MTPPPRRGRIFVASRRVRLGDADPRGELRLDALARYLQDVATDDSLDCAMERSMAWVVRKTTVVIQSSPKLGEELELATFCSGTGSHFARRRTSIAGADGAAIEVVALWVHVDLDSGRPRRLGADFHEIYGEAAEGRHIRARLTHSDPPTGTTGRPFELRSTDLDVLDHVNNAVFWVGVEEELARRAVKGPRGRAEVEYRAPVLGTDAVRLESTLDSNLLRLWFVVDDQVKASAVVG
ncbi:MAG: acyl-[acyl-carrier-protein] thioesterase [Acidimicrobiales bacterium]